VLSQCIDTTQTIPEITNQEKRKENKKQIRGNKETNEIKPTDQTISQIK